MVPLPIALPLLTLVAACTCLGAIALDDLHRIRSTELAAKAQLESREQAMKTATRTTQARTTHSVVRR